MGLAGLACMLALYWFSASGVGMFANEANSVFTSFSSAGVTSASHFHAD
jgi:hypothetical protein